MHGNPKFCFWITRALAKFCFSLHSLKPRKNIPVLVGTTHRKPEYLEMRRTNAQQKAPSLISQRETTYALRGKDILTMPKVNTTRFGLKSWRFQAPKLWNSLPDVVRASSDFKTFRKLLANESILL